MKKLLNFLFNRWRDANDYVPEDGREVLVCNEFYQEVVSYDHDAHKWIGLHDNFRQPIFWKELGSFPAIKHHAHGN